MALQEFDRSLYFLIEVDPTSHPPVCRLFEKKQLFEKEKANKKKKKTNTPEQITKEINFGWNVSLHDMGHKLTKAIQFLEKGNKVKIEILHKKGQQRVDKDTQQEVIDQVQQQLKDFKLSKPPTRSGSNCMMQFELRK
ncbi:translation initiation factor IF-3, C-terminal domain-containing protein [Cunninghamella echinulata]|nr:translation initiation factor IF-3, C-terminal domain-containing protein [Cunninghamella echinulata]